MAIKKETCLYEVLLRFGPEGFRGAHVQDLERIVEGDKVHAETPALTRAVTLEEVGQYIGAENAKLIEAADAEKARADAAEARAEELEGALADERAAREAAEAKLQQIASAISG